MLLKLPLLLLFSGLLSKAIAQQRMITGKIPWDSSEFFDESRRWNFHVQNTEIVQGDPAFPAKYSGPNSLNSKGEVQETVTLDLYAGIRLWHGAEAHVDFLMWQGFGLSQTYGIEAFPNGDA